VSRNCLQPHRGAERLGAVLHYQVLEKARPAARHSLLIDAGAEFAGYASDITRTYSHEDASFGRLIERMDRLQQALCAGVRAGVDWRDVHLRAHLLTGEVLRDADLISCGADEAVATGLTRVFLPHGIGHLLGSKCTTSVASWLPRKAGNSPAATRPLPATHPQARGALCGDHGAGHLLHPQLLDAVRAGPVGRRINWPCVEGS